MRINASERLTSEQTQENLNNCLLLLLPEIKRGGQRGCSERIKKEEKERILFVEFVYDSFFRF
jgi:hypothetical protein